MPSRPAQLGVLSQLAEGALDLVVCAIDEDIKPHWSQYGPLRDTAHHHLDIDPLTTALCSSFLLLFRHHRRV